MSIEVTDRSVGHNTSNPLGIIDGIPDHILNPEIYGKEPINTVPEFDFPNDSPSHEFDASNFEMSENTRQLFNILPPKQEVAVGDRNFLLSSVALSAGRKYAIGYTQLDNGQLAPRLFYKSKSDGFWRVTPEVHVSVAESGKENLRYSKGETMDYGYVRETRLHDDLSEALEQAENNFVSIDDGYFTNEVLKKFTADKLGDTKTYEEEAFGINVAALRDFFLYNPGQGFEADDGDTRPARDRIKDMKVDPPMKPDFTEGPSKTALRKHEMLGDVVIESYPSFDGRFLWNMARTRAGNVWVNGITRNKEEPVSSYGTDYEVNLAGIIDSKPIEYVDQLGGLEKDIDYVEIPGTLYALLTVLENLEPIKEFRDARGIEFKQPT